MPYVKKYVSASEVNFLASSKIVTFTYQVSDSGVTANADGLKIVPAGTVYPANDGTAVGITLTDTDVTAGPQPAAVIVEGYILEARLPVAPASAAKTAMKEIKFR